MSVKMAYLETGYWVWQFFAVLCGYLFLMFLWPTVVFYRHLRGKGKIYRFSFCVVVQPVLVSTVVLSLGLLHILDRRIVWVLLVASFLFMLLHICYDEQEKIQWNLYMLEKWGTRGTRSLSERFRQWFPQFLQRLRPNLWEYLIITVLLVYALIYFSWGVFQYNSYAYGDEYVHHSWVQGLLEGKAFASGIYPAAMHCFIYSIHVLAGVPVYSIQLFLGSIHTLTILLSAYLLLRELFVWRYTPAFSLALFLFLNGSGTTYFTKFGMSRFSWTLPQEFGMAPMFLCALFLERYLKNQDATEKGWRNKELFLFLMALAATITIHFYATIMAFFLCLAISLRYLRRIFTRERFLQLACAVLCGVALAFAPMLAGKISGIPFQGSINWAMKAVQGEEFEESRPATSQENFIQNSKNGRLLATADFYISGVRRGYTELYGKSRGGYLMVQAGLFFAVVLLLLRFRSRLPEKFRNWIKEKGIEDPFCTGWLQLTIAAVLLMLVYSAPYIGLPELVVGSRLSAVISILMASMVMIPLDAVFVWARNRYPERVLQPVSFACLVAIYTIILGTGNYHSFLYGELTRYDADVAVVNSIIDNFPEKSYTIVSPTDGLYQSIQKGWHEEILTFAQGIEEEEYTLPSEYVFIFVEKKPLYYGQTIYATGPAWLGTNRTEENVSIRSSEITWEASRMPLKTFRRPFDSYRDQENRTIIESRVYYWCHQFARLYPREMKVYYEDDDFVCYWFRQEPGSPYNLGSLYDMPKITLNTEEFTESARALQNPDRGFYKIHQYTITDIPQNYATMVKRSNTGNEENTLALVEVNLRNYRYGEITAAGLENLESLFDALRAEGKRIILRFLYDWDGLNLQREPQRLDIILTHMEQVGEVVRKNSDIIFTLQGLFVGSYGEMHSTRYTAVEDQQQLARKLMEVTDGVFLAVRTPTQWRNITGQSDASRLTRTASRLGLFNDAILSGSTDLGTYREDRREEELTFQEKLCGQVPNGGEIITDNPYNDFYNAVRDLSRMHITYLNQDYDRAVLNKWAGVTVSEQGCFDGMDGLSYMERHLGYRLVLDKVKLQRDLLLTTISAEATFRNAGFAPPYREPEVLLRLVEETTGRTLEYPFSQGLCALKGRTSQTDHTTVTADISVAELPKGKYNAYLTLTDPASGAPILLAVEADPEENGYLIGTIERR